MAFRTIVTYEEMEEKIPASVREALLDLEAAGFSVLVDAEIEDARLKDGTRRLTFRMAGKYALAIAVKNVDDLVDVETRISALAEENQEQGRVIRNLKDKLGRREKAGERLRKANEELGRELELLAAQGDELTKRGAELQAQIDGAEAAEPEAKAGGDSGKE